MLHIARNKFSFPASWRRTFAVTLFFVTLSAGLFWLDYFRSYSAKVTILVISRSNISQSGADIAENLAELTRTLSFYDRMLADNDLIDDAFEGFAPDKRKKFWNDAVTVKKIDEGSVLSLRAIGDTSEEVMLLSRQTARTLFSVAGFYYNVKTDIDLRIIDGPLVSTVVVKPFLYSTVSILTGFFITALFFLLLNRAPGLIVKRKSEVSLDELVAEHDVTREKYATPERSYPEFAQGEAVPWIDPRKFIPAKPTTLSFENVMSGAKKSVTIGTRAPAPANLPVATSEREFSAMDEAALPFEFEAPAEEPEAAFSPIQGEPLGQPLRSEHAIATDSQAPSEGESATSTDEFASPTSSSRVEASLTHPDGRDEPTAEEYKRRLNKLLSGGN